MTLPITPNPISLSQIQTEFGGSAPTQLTEYYAGGAYVPGGTVGFPGGISTPIPTSGTISLQNFYGSTALSIVQITSSGTWTCPAGVTSMAVLLAAGGGGGGMAAGADGGGGGGAGGAYFIPNYLLFTPGGSIPIIIGAGGSGTTGDQGTSGTMTQIGTIPFANTLTGGGGGGGSVNRSGLSGGSGGGGCGYGGGNPGGTGTGGQGYAGGSAGEFNTGGGGGGASVVGHSTSYAGLDNSPGKGGAGLEVLLPLGSTITPWNGSYGTPYTASSIVVAGGGGGGRGSSSWPGVGGSGAGGSGGNLRITGPATPGIVNTGGGGGGAYADATLPLPPAANGGSGVVYIILNPPALRTSAVSTFDSGLETLWSNYDLATTVGFSMNSDGTISSSHIGGGGVDNLGTSWHSAPVPGIGSSYWIYAVESPTGSGSISGPLNTWINLGSTQSWSLTSTPLSPGSGLPYRSYRYLTIQIAESSGGPVIATAVIQMAASSLDS